MNIYLQSFVFRKLLYKEIVVIIATLKTYIRKSVLSKYGKKDISVLLEIDYLHYIYIYIYI